MSGKAYIDRDVELALKLRTDVVRRAAEDLRGFPSDEPFIPSLLAIKHNRIYVWEPPAIDAFWKFWDVKANWARFKRDFFRGEDLIYREQMVGGDFHLFPAPGRLFGPDTLAEENRDVPASIIFPPTTRAIGTSSYHVGDRHFLPTVIDTVLIDPKMVETPRKSMLRLDRLPALPDPGTLEAGKLICTVESRFPKVVGGLVVDRKPLTWLACLYRLQIFLVQPFVGYRRQIRRSPKKGARFAHEPPAVVRVLMRDPLPTRISRYIFPTVHPLTGRKLEFEVEVRAHERHCASGKIAQVRSHKRGPSGRSREKVIKVIR